MVLEENDGLLDRRRALSVLLQYAEQEAIDLNEPGLAAKIRTAYLGTKTPNLPLKSDMFFDEINKFQS